MDPLFPHSIAIEYLKQNYFKFYNNKYFELMSSKLGINNKPDNQKLIEQLIDNMHICGTHYTNFFRLIEENAENPRSEAQLIADIISQSEPT